MKALATIPLLICLLLMGCRSEHAVDARRTYEGPLGGEFKDAELKVQLYGESTAIWTKGLYAGYGWMPVEHIVSEGQNHRFNAALGGPGKALSYEFNVSIQKSDDGQELKVKVKALSGGGNEWRTALTKVAEQVDSSDR